MRQTLGSAARANRKIFQDHFHTGKSATAFCKALCSLFIHTGSPEVCLCACAHCVCSHAPDCTSAAVHTRIQNGAAEMGSLPSSYLLSMPDRIRELLPKFASVSLNCQEKEKGTKIAYFTGKKKPNQRSERRSISFFFVRQTISA